MNDDVRALYINQLICCHHGVEDFRVDADAENRTILDSFLNDSANMTLVAFWDSSLKQIRLGQNVSIFQIAILNLLSIIDKTPECVDKG